MINAPQDLVFKAWTDQEQIRQWWGPEGFTNPVCIWNAQPGSTIRIEMRAPDGVVYPMDGLFREVIEPEKIVFTSIALDPEGNYLFEILNTVLFSREGNKTKLTMHAQVTNVTDQAEPYLAGMDAGWNQSINKLEKYLAA
jgi:uncharacterized protein YndB with AHSA1/START domain